MRLSGCAGTGQHWPMGKELTSAAVLGILSTIKTLWPALLIMIQSRQQASPHLSVCSKDPKTSTRNKFFLHTGTGQHWPMGKEATSAAVLGMPININTLRLPTPGGGQGFSAVQQSMLEALKLTPPQQFKDWHVRLSWQLPLSFP